MNDSTHHMIFNKINFCLW